MARPAGSFLRGDERRWISSSLFFHCVERLGLQARIYYIPVGVVVTPTELIYYAAHLRAELDTLPKTCDEQAYAYAQNVCTLLRRWAQEGHSVLVV